MARGDLQVASPEAAEQVALCVQARLRPSRRHRLRIVVEQAASTVAAEPGESAAAAGTVANATVLQRSDGSRYYAAAKHADCTCDVGSGKRTPAN